MKRFKDEVDQIEIPKELHERVIQGIDKADIEKKKKKYRILPTIVAITFTVAASFFVILEITKQSTIIESVFQTSSLAEALPVFIGSNYMLALIISIVLFLLATYLLKKRSLSRIWTIGLTIVVLIWVWNLAIFKENQLHERIVFPVSIEAVEGYPVQFSLFYLTNRQDMKKVSHLEINGEILLPLEQSIRTDDYGYTHQKVTQESFIIRPHLFSKIQSPGDSFVVFNNMEKAPIDFQFDSLPNSSSIKYLNFGEDPVSGMTFTYNSNRFNEHQVALDIAEDLIITNVKIGNNLRITDIGKWLDPKNMSSSTFPIEAKSGERVIVKYESTQPNFTTIQAPIFIETTKGTTVMNAFYHSTITKQDVEHLVDQQRGEKDGKQ